MSGIMSTYRQLHAAHNSKLDLLFGLKTQHYTPISFPRIEEEMIEHPLDLI